VDEHQERIENLCRYANKLHGTGDLLAEGDKLDILFESFPQKWKTSFILSGKIPLSANESVIIEFMKVAKGIADTDDSKRIGKKGKRKIDDEDEKKGKNNRYMKGKGGRGRGQGHGKADPEAMCRVRKDHKWKDCPNNFSSANFIPRNEAAGR